jgi:uncharacterized caspase-like protein
MMTRLSFSVSKLVQWGLLLTSPLLLLSCSSGPTIKSPNESRVALVVGNADYQFLPQLNNPVNDAKDMSEALKDLGFNVIYRQDADKSSMAAAIEEFKQALASERQQGKETAGLFYYSGHGAQYGDENYLLPVGLNAKASDDSDVIFASETVALNSVFDGMNEANSTMQIVVLDACRDNPLSQKDFFTHGSKSVGKGLTWVDDASISTTTVPHGTFIAYATAPNQVAYDDSLYTKHLLANIREEGLSIEELFKKVRISVVEETNERQQPWDNSSLKGEFYFAGKKKEPDEPKAILSSGGFK